MQKIKVKPIPEFPGYYASRCGKIYSKKHKEPREMKPGMNEGGYYHVGLFQNRKKKTKKVHRLILLTYVGPPPKGMQCDHIDGNRQNNNLPNLEWVIRSENMRRGDIRNGGKPGNRGEKHGNSKLTEKNIHEIRALLRKGVFQKDIAERYGIGQGAISKIKTGKRWAYTV